MNPESKDEKLAPDIPNQMDNDFHEDAQENSISNPESNSDAKDNQEPNYIPKLIENNTMPPSNFGNSSNQGKSPDVDELSDKFHKFNLNDFQEQNNPKMNTHNNAKSPGLAFNYFFGENSMKEHQNEDSYENHFNQRNYYGKDNKGNAPNPEEYYEDYMGKNSRFPNNQQRSNYANNDNPMNSNFNYQGMQDPSFMRNQPPVLPKKPENEEELTYSFSIYNLKKDYLFLNFGKIYGKY